MNLYIGNLSLENNIFLAPMAGITDMAFRIICKEFGCGLMFTEMVSAKGLYYQDEKSKALAFIGLNEGNVAVQLFGSDPLIIAKAIEWLNNSVNTSIIDINMGCPVPKVIRNKEGCALMLQPELVGKIVKEAVIASVHPITIKIRKGWDENNINAVEIAKIAEQNGASAITIHGRTRCQFYSGKADLDIIRQVKKSVSIPVIGNGDIFDTSDAKNMFLQTGCDGIMIARGALGNPWIFRDILENINRDQAINKPTMHDKIKLIKHHIDLMQKFKGDISTSKEIKKHISWYLKGIKNSSHIRDLVFRATCLDEILYIIRQQK